MGFASHATKVLKSNRALIKKRRSLSDIREEYEGYLPNAKLEFKELTEFEKKKIRDKIIAQAKKDRVYEAKLYLISLLFLLLILICLYYLFFE